MASHDAAPSIAEPRRRADELVVLNDLARRPAALHDTRDVLDEVARQARRLLGVDVAHIMLLRGEVLRIEDVDGAMDSTMRGIELERGQGLGGQVLAAGRPLWSERYLEDAGFPHTDGVDPAASSEQLGGILGVPLLVGDETIGVLLAAERRARAFAAHDVELLAGLAAHAALALRTADLFDRERAAATELRAANTALQELNASRERTGDLRDVLHEVVLHGGGLPEVVAALHRSAGLVVAVRDDDGRTLAGDEPGDGGLVVPVELTGGHGGDLVAAPTTVPEEEAVRLLRIGATTVAVLLAPERSVAEAELRGWSAAHAGQVVVLLPAPVEQARAAVARMSAGEVGTPTVGLATGAGGPAGVRASHEEARQTAALLIALDRAGTCATGTDLGLYRSLFSRSGRADLTAFVRATIGPLLDHDRDKQRELATTVETYLEQARHHARTCEALHIHANTLYQRLDRITEVRGPRWKEPGRALELQVALRLHRLIAERSD